jgi:hypothetical protein
MMDDMSADPSCLREPWLRKLARPNTLGCVRRAGWLGVWLLLGPAMTVADEPKVTIAGGVRPGNQQYYDWKVTNHHTTPVVYLEFLQYHGDLFTAPSGWSQEWKNRAMIGGGKNAPGWVRTRAENSGAGIQAGRSAAFEMRIARAGALTRAGRVTVRFADESEIIIANVELPCAPGFTEQHVMLFALAAIFVIALAIHRRRRRAAADTAATTSSATDDERQIHDRGA